MMKLVPHKQHENPSDSFRIVDDVYLGKGSMGSVIKVQKTHDNIGGSAREGNRKTFMNVVKRNSSNIIQKLNLDFCRHCQNDDDIRHNMDENEKSFVYYNDEESYQSCYTFAMKSIHINKTQSSTYIYEMLNEISLLRQIDHFHIVKALESYSYNGNLFLVMEYLSGGNLYSRDPYTEDQARIIVRDLCKAIKYLHSRNIAHRDIKFENILFENSSPNARIKLIDFGLSSFYSSDSDSGFVCDTPTNAAVKSGMKQKVKHSKVGTIYTSAPEILSPTTTTSFNTKSSSMMYKAADMWSIGVISYMLLSSELPFFGRKRKYMTRKILACDYDMLGERWNDVSVHAKDFVRSLLKYNPEERPSAKELLRLKNGWLMTQQAQQHKRIDSISTSTSTLSYKSSSSLGNSSFSSLRFSYGNQKTLSSMDGDDSCHSTSTSPKISHYCEDYVTQSTSISDYSLMTSPSLSEESLSSSHHSSQQPMVSPMNSAAALTSPLSTPSVLDKTLLEDTWKALETYHNTFPILKRIGMMIIAHQSLTRKRSTTVSYDLHTQLFEYFDKSQNGYISQDDFVQVFGEGREVLEFYTRFTNDIVSFHTSTTGEERGIISYTHFIAATLSLLTSPPDDYVADAQEGLLREEQIAEAFDCLDSNDTGYVSLENMQDFLKYQSVEVVDTILQEIDFGKYDKRQISYDDFLSLWS